MSSHMTSGTIKSFLPIFYVSKFFGCNLYPLPKPLNSSNSKINLRAIDFLVYVVNVFLYILIIGSYIKKWEDKDSIYRSEFLTPVKTSGLTVVIIIGRALNYMCICMNLFFMGMDMRNSKTIRSILLSLIDFDNKMEGYGVKIDFNYKQISLSYGFVILLTQILTLLVSFVMSHKFIDGKLIFIVEMYFGNAMMDGCMCSYLWTYLFFVSNLADRLSTINLCLKKQLPMEKVHLGAMEKQAVNNSNIISSLSIVHQNLFDTVRRINSCYALQFIFFMLVIFLFSLVNSFMYYQILVFEKQKESLLIGVFYTSRTACYNFGAYKIISTGSKIMKEKRITRSLVNKLMSLSHNNMPSAQVNLHPTDKKNKNNLSINTLQVRSRLRCFCYQIEHSNVIVTCGLFTVDWTLLYTFASAVGTYLLLFIQFDYAFSIN